MSSPSNTTPADAWRIIRGTKLDQSNPAHVRLAEAMARQIDRDAAKLEREARANKRAAAARKSQDIVRPQPVRLERHEQADLARWLDDRGVLWTHVPNEGKRSGRYGASLRSQGLKRGCPDCLIFSPLRRPPGGVQPRGVAIELKRADGKGRLSPEQNEWLVELAKAGWLCRCCNGAAEAIRWLEELGL